MLFDTASCSIQQLKDERFDRKQLSVAVLRLDRIHPVVSGNKLFKLHYFLEEAMQAPAKMICTFGGAWSNHLVATAFACKTARLNCVGIIRGERPAVLSDTLSHCIQYGMQLKFISRNEYDQKDTPEFRDTLKTTYGECFIIPEGGYHPLGAKGAALIMDLVKAEKFTHICTATGTATTLAGLLTGAGEEQQVIGINVLKGITDTVDRVRSLTAGMPVKGRLQVWDEYHFGGYAKKTSALIDFMNRLWTEQQVPTDFVYTAKMLYAVYDRIERDHFPPGSSICCVHTGGLQGNNSLSFKTLLY